MLQPQLEMKYFVLKPRSKHENDLYAKASQKAMQKYAKVIRDINEDFANEIYEWVSREKEITKSMFGKEKV